MLFHPVQIFGRVGGDGTSDSCAAVYGMFLLGIIACIGAIRLAFVVVDVLAFMSYHLLYWLERWFGHHSSFDWEALEHCSDALYLRKRKSRAWMKWYGKKSLPPSEWEDD